MLPTQTGQGTAACRPSRDYFPIDYLKQLVINQS